MDSQMGQYVSKDRETQEEQQHPEPKDMASPAQ